MSGELLCIIPGPTVLLHSELDDRERWCFKCRYRHLHTWELRGDPSPSYYDPNWSLRCPHCKGDYTRFPGGEML